MRTPSAHLGTIHKGLAALNNVCRIKAGTKLPAGLVDVNGTLYGTTETYGGSECHGGVCGVVFKVTGFLCPHCTPPYSVVPYSTPFASIKPASGTSPSLALKRAKRVSPSTARSCVTTVSRAPTRARDYDAA